MTQQKLKRQLKASLHDIEKPVRQEHLELTKSLLAKERYQHDKRERLSFTRFLSMQIRFIGWKIWAMQGAMLIAVSFFLAASMGEYFLDNPRFVALLLCGLSILVIMTALPFIQRALHYRMNEIEAATYFSSVKLLMAKLLIIGIGDVSMLSCILCFVIFKTSLPTQSAILYLLLPFLLASCGLLYLLGHVPAKRFAAGSIVVCAVLIAAFILLAELYPFFFEQAFSIGWAAICIALVVYCVCQFRRIIARSSYAEMQLI